MRNSLPKVHDTAGSNGSRRGRVARVSTTLAEINVVPLVDVMLVLLIIFMVTAPMMQQGLQVQPSAGAALHTGDCGTGLCHGAGRFHSHSNRANRQGRCAD
jgi:hypothetical protein